VQKIRLRFFLLLPFFFFLLEKALV